MHSFKCIQFFPPLFCSSGGLDTLVRDLPVEDRRFISGWLNGQTTDGKQFTLSCFAKHLFVRITGELKLFLESLFEISRKFSVVCKQ